MTLFEKLIEIRKKCEYLKKDNQGYQFKFVSSSQTLGTLRAEMDNQKVLLIPSVNSFEVRDHTTDKGKHEYFTILDITYTWVDAENPSDQVVCKWTGQGLDNGEKGVGKALTYAEKYFLLKFFNIATDKDDPDAHQQQNTLPTAPKPNPQTEREKKAEIYSNLKKNIEVAQKVEELDGLEDNGDLLSLPKTGQDDLIKRLSEKRAALVKTEMEQPF